MDTSARRARHSPRSMPLSPKVGAIAERLIAKAGRCAPVRNMRGAGIVATLGAALGWQADSLLSWPKGDRVRAGQASRLLSSLPSLSRSPFPRLVRGSQEIRAPLLAPLPIRSTPGFPRIAVRSLHRSSVAPVNLAMGSTDQCLALRPHVSPLAHQCTRQFDSPARPASEREHDDDPPADVESGEGCERQPAPRCRARLVTSQIGESPSGYLI